MRCKNLFSTHPTSAQVCLVTSSLAAATFRNVLSWTLWYVQRKYSANKNSSNQGWILIKCGLEEPWSSHGCSSCHQNSCPSPQAHWQGCSSQPISGEVMGEKIQSSLLTPVAPRMTILGLGYRCSLLPMPGGGPRHSTESTRFHNHNANSALKLATKRFIFLTSDPLDLPSLAFS